MAAAELRPSAPCAAAPHQGSANLGFDHRAASVAAAPWRRTAAGPLRRCPLLPSRVALMLLPLLILPRSALAAGSDDEPFDVHVMLRAAVSASVDQAALGAVGLDEASKVSEACVSSAAGEAWRRDFEAGVASMLQKTRRTMQQGLKGVAQSMIDLVDTTTCGDFVVFKRFKEQATRLRVLATSRSLAHLDSKVKYEPLKALTVGDVDVHLELNALIVAWQLKKGPEEVGRALTALLRDFISEDDAPETAQEAPPATAAPTPSLSAQTKARQTPEFWKDVLSRALEKFGDFSMSVFPSCLTEEIAKQQSELVSAAFDTMMQKSRRGMQQGIRQVATSTLELLNRVEAECDHLKRSIGMQKLRNAADRLTVLAASKNLLNPGGKVDYDPMKSLKVGGVDVHLELNRFIGAWINEYTAREFGEGLADFFDDFKEQEEVDDKSPAAAAPPEDGMFRMLKDAIVAAMAGRNEKLDLASHCYPTETTATFVLEVNAAIDHMLQKRKRTMQQGLKELAGATDKLLGAQKTECIWSSGAKVIWQGAKKLRKVTSRMVVDYGTHIKYEAMKSLTVGGVAIHTELNNFLAGWRLRSQEESGEAFGELMQRLSTITGYDEL